MERFTVVFEKLEEMSAEVRSIPLQPSEASPSEIDEIAELGRMVLEITEPPPLSYTTT